MAKEKFIDLHLGFVYSPLNVSYGIVADGNVADIQSFDQSDNRYIPDYTSVYLVLKPWMRIVDPDGVLPAGEVQMANMHWYVFDGTAETEISNGTDYQIAADGRLSVRRNIDPGKSLLFRFCGEYLDPRTGEVWRMEDTHGVSCETESAPLRLLLNQPEYVEWDPTNTDDPQKIVLKTSLFIGKDDVAATDREFVWEKKDGNDADFCRIYRENDPNYDHADYDVELSADESSLILKRELMGMRVDIRVRARYDPYGNPSSATLDDRSPSATAAFTRNIPDPDVTVLTPTQFPPTQKTFQPEAVFMIGKRAIANPEKFWRIKWYLSKCVAAGTVSRTLVGEGSKPTLPTSYIAKGYGAVLQVGVTEKDPLAAVTSDGYILTSDGAVILA